MYRNYNHWNKDPNAIKLTQHTVKRKDKSILSVSLTNDFLQTEKTKNKKKIKVRLKGILIRPFNWASC